MKEKDDERNGTPVRAEVPGLGERFVIDGARVSVFAPKKKRDKGKRKRVVLEVTAPALADPAALVMNRDEVDTLVQLLLVARRSLWDLDAKPPKHLEIDRECDCPKCRARRAAEAEG